MNREQFGFDLGRKQFSMLLILTYEIAPTENVYSPSDKARKRRLEGKKTKAKKKWNDATRFTSAHLYFSGWKSVFLSRNMWIPRSRRDPSTPPS
jgi:hypothetical protein